MSSLIVDLAQEKEAAYRRIFGRSPLLSSVSVEWDGILAAYDDLAPGETPEIYAKQHGVGIFIDMPKPAQVERMIDGRYKREQVIQGDIIIVPADTWHQTTSYSGARVVFLSFEPEDFTQAVNETAERDSVELIPHFTTADPLVHQIGVALKRALENSSSASRLYAETLITALMAHLMQYYCAKQVTLPTYTGGLSKLKLRQVIDYIQAHLSDNLSLKEIAAIAQLSPHYFSQLFKQSTGLTPHQYVIRCRVDRAQVLLSQGKLTISHISQIVGFVDQSHLHRHFKQIVGVTPRAFRQQTKR